MGSGDSQPPRKPYGSAADLPSYRSMRQQMASASVLTLIIARDQRPVLKGIKRDLEQLIATVDRFYDRLGDRHWIFTDSLPVDTVRQILEEGDSDDEAEAALISLYRDESSLERWCLRFRVFEELRAREQLITRARMEYVCDHFDSCTHLLVAIMDGFVNDLEPAARRGLHARDPADMVAWDSVVGHHLGLTNALNPFLETFKKRVDDEVFEVHRHGIVHGSVVSYNNVVVATKAWNLLFAVADWAAATRKASVPADEPVSWRSLVKKIASNARTREKVASWRANSFTPADDQFTALDAYGATAGFLEAWETRNYGALAAFENQLFLVDRRPGEVAGEMRHSFELFALSDYSIAEIENSAPAIWTARGTAIVNGTDGVFECRWILQGEDGFPDLDSPGAALRLTYCSPSIWSASPGHDPGTAST